MKPTAKTPTKHDLGLEWLREIRRTMAAECNYDPAGAGTGASSSRFWN